MENKLPVFDGWITIRSSWPPFELWQEYLRLPVGLRRSKQKADDIYMRTLMFEFRFGSSRCLDRE